MAFSRLSDAPSRLVMHERGGDQGADIEGPMEIDTPVGACTSLQELKFKSSSLESATTPLGRSELGGQSAPRLSSIRLAMPMPVEES